MNEESNVQTVVDDDIIDFDPADFPGEVEDEGDAVEEPQADEPGQEAPAADQQEEPAAEEPEQPEQPEEEFELSGGLKVKRDALLELANKGQSFDQTARQLETLQTQLTEAEKFRAEHADAVEDLLALAQMTGKSVADILDAMKVGEKIQRTGMNREAAVEEVRRERAARAQRQQTAQEQRQQAQRQQEDAQARIDREVGAFLTAYPGVKPDQVPKEVWAEVRKGVPLLNAYQAHEMKKLSAELERLKAETETAAKTKAKNEENREKAVGSMRSHGTSSSDAFLIGFNKEFD